MSPLQGEGRRFDPVTRYQDQSVSSPKKAIMKPTKTFKLSKRNKTLTALLPFKDADARSGFKRMMIDAQLSSEVVIRSSKDRGTDNK